MQDISEIKGKIYQFVNSLIKKIKDPTLHLAVPPSQIKTAIYKYLNSVSAVNKKIQFCKIINSYIYDFVQNQCQSFLKNYRSYQKFNFVEAVDRIWSNCQRFTYALQFITDRITEFLQDFNRNQVYYQNTDVQPFAAVCVNKLKRIITQDIIFKYVQHFNSFISDERKGKAVSKDLIRESITFFESLHYNFEAYCQIDINKRPIIVKKEGLRKKLKQAHQATDHEFFNKNLLNTLICQCKKEYKNNDLHQRLIKMSATDEINKILEILDTERQNIINYYFHSAENIKKYEECINENLLVKNIEERIKKPDGLTMYLQNYKYTNNDYEKEIKNYWKVFSRTGKISITETTNIFADYLVKEAKEISKKIQNFRQFIPLVIELNRKLTKIISLFDKSSQINFQLENERSKKIKELLASDYCEEPKFRQKKFIGASHLAVYFNVKIRSNYTDLTNFAQDYELIVELFKLLENKMQFVTEHQKQLANRLEEIDFSKELECSNILTQQKKFIDQLQKESGASTVRTLQQNIKDVQSSIDQFKEIQKKIGNKIVPCKQILLKHTQFWPQKVKFEIQTPTTLIKAENSLEEYYDAKGKKIKLQLNNGMSVFKGKFKPGPQVFNFKNIYLIILLTIDQQPNKSILFGHLRQKVSPKGAKKQRSLFELCKVIVQLLFLGLLLSNNKNIMDEQKLASFNDSQKLSLNCNFNFAQQARKKKFPQNTAKILKMVPLPSILNKKLNAESKDNEENERQEELKRKNVTQALLVKCLKHEKKCSYQTLLKSTQIPKYAYLRTNQRFIKQIIEELINKKYVKRVKDQKNMLQYLE